MSEPYVIVVFSNRRVPGAAGDPDGYAAMAARMEELARAQPGFRGIESARDADGFGITASYWDDAESAAAWKQVLEHLDAQALGRRRWYEHYDVRIGTITREYSWTKWLFHIALPTDWAAAQAEGRYAISTRNVTLAQEGFIHCSYEHQLDATANRFYGDLDELTLLRIDAARLTARVIVEPPYSGSPEDFPHVYGAIDLAAVVAATPWRRAAGEPWALDLTVR